MRPLQIRHFRLRHYPLQFLLERRDGLIEFLLIALLKLDCLQTH